MSTVNVHVQPNKIYKDHQSLSIEEWGVRDNLRKKFIYKLQSIHNCTITYKCIAFKCIATVLASTGSVFLKSRYVCSTMKIRFTIPRNLML